MPDATSPPSASTRAIELIKQEHRALARVLGAMQALVARHRDAGEARNFELFDAMLNYIENLARDRLCGALRKHQRKDKPESRTDCDV